MKNTKQYYIIFGASVCVGVATIFYFLRRRNKDVTSELVTDTYETTESTEGDTIKPVNVKLLRAIKSDKPSIDQQNNDLSIVSPSQSQDTSDMESSQVMINKISSIGPEIGVCTESACDVKKRNGPINSGPAKEAVGVKQQELEYSLDHKTVSHSNSVSELSKSVPSDGSSEGVSPMQIAETLMRLSKPGSLSNLSLEDARVLKYTMSFVHGKELARILEIIAQAACFRINLPVLSTSSCFLSTQQLLRQAAADRRFCPEAVKISLLHALTNLSCSEEHQQALKTSVDDLFCLSEGQEESRVGVACLCVIANLSLTKYCHPEIGAFGTRLFELLEDEDTALLKQVLTILLNLCCEKSTVPLLLTARAPPEMGTFVAQTGTIGTNTDLLIKWLRILRNLYKVIREESITAESLGLTSKDTVEGSVFKELQRLRLHMKACVFLLCHNKESHGLAAGAKMLYEYLEVNE